MRRIPFLRFRRSASRGLPLLALLALAGPASAASVEHGKEVFAIAAGCGCHTMKAGPVAAGGAEIDTPFGKFFGSNITPDAGTGIGAWTDDEIDAAIRRGRLRGGDTESPVMPYYLYAGMSDADVADLIAYLRSLAPVLRLNHPHEGELPMSRWAYWAWRLLFVRSVTAPSESPGAGVERGRYLADHVALCADCHTPRSVLGTVTTSMYMAGTQHGPGGHPVPNITADETGIRGWDAGDIGNLLSMGMLPDMDSVQGAMEDVVDGVGGGPGYKDATESDRLAIAEYLLTVAPIANKVNDE